MHKIRESQHPPGHGGPDSELRIRGPLKLAGRIKIQGSKKAASGVVFAALLTQENCEIRRLPAVTDVLEILWAVTRSGGRCSLSDEVALVGDGFGTVSVDTQDAVGRSGVLLASIEALFTGQATLSAQGGCPIGARPVDFHAHVLKAMGASVQQTAAGYRVTAIQLRGAHIILPFPSVGATQQALLLGALARGKTRIEGAATDPEIVELIHVLQKMGAKVHAMDGSRAITLEGSPELTGFSHEVSPDRVEAASWACAAAATHGSLVLEGISGRSMGGFVSPDRALGG